MAHPGLAAAGEHHAAEHRAVWPRLDIGAGVGGDRLGGRVGLLGGEAALLDREGDRVAGRPDRVDIGNPAVQVGRDEATGVGGKPRQAGPDRPGERDDSLGVERPLAGMQDEPAGSCGSSATYTPVSASTPASSRSWRTATVAGVPNSPSGASSGV